MCLLKQLGTIIKPKGAAKQGLTRMKPWRTWALFKAYRAHERPHIPTLRLLVFSGSECQTVLETSAKNKHLSFWLGEPPASCMWTAKRLHRAHQAAIQWLTAEFNFTPDLTWSINFTVRSNWNHRAILQATFKDDKHFASTPHYQVVDHFGDEGAAKHTRFATKLWREQHDFLSMRMGSLQQQRSLAQQNSLLVTTLEASASGLPVVMDYPVGPSGFTPTGISCYWRRCIP